MLDFERGEIKFLMVRICGERGRNVAILYLNCVFEFGYLELWKMTFRGVLKKDSILNRDFLIDSNLEKNFFRFKLIGGFGDMVE